MMQTDVVSAHIGQTGFLMSGRTRLKQITYSGNAGQAGVLGIFDSVNAAISAVYARSGATITVTKSAHGLATGDKIGIAFASAASASGTDNNYIVTVVDSSTFTVTDTNSGTVSGGTACYYVNSGGRWLTSFNTLTGATSAQQVTIPGEGMLVTNGLYAVCTYISFVTVFYG
jgi:hypothetical protein